MTTDIRDLLDDAADAPRHGIDVDALQHRARRRQHRRSGAIVGTLVVLALVTGGVVVAATDDATSVRTPAAAPTPVAEAIPDGWHRVESKDAGISIAIPPDWGQLPNQVFTDVETGLASNVLAVGTATRPPFDACVPDGVVVLAPSGAWLSINEYVGRPGGEHQFVGMPLEAFPDRPADFREVREVGVSYVDWRCGDRAGEQLVFRDQGRYFWASVSVIGDPDGEGLRTGREILNTLRVEPLTPEADEEMRASVDEHSNEVQALEQEKALENDKVAAQAAMLGWLNRTSPGSEVDFVEDYDGIADALREGRAQHSPENLAAFSGTVESVTVLDPDRIEVRYSLLQFGVPLYPNRTGTVIRVDGAWKVSRETVRALLALGNVQCPPRE